MTPLRLYVASLAAVVATSLAATGSGTADFGGNLPAWLFLTGLIGLSEHSTLFFHDERTRFGLSFSEAILLPMLIFFSWPQVVWGATLGMAVGRAGHFRMGATKNVFNIAQYGCSAALAAAVWGWFAEPAEALSVRNVCVAGLGVVTFAATTHVLTSIAISLATRRRPRFVSVSIASPTVANVAGNVVLGLLFAAGYEGAEWTVLTFPLPLAALSLGFRALLRHGRERERVEQIHAATRALAASWEPGEAMLGFVGAVGEIVSATETHVVVELQGEMRWSALRAGAVVADLKPLGAGPLRELALAVERHDGPVLAHAGDTGPVAVSMRELGVRSLVGTRLAEGEQKGALLAFDYVGVDDFSGAEATLLQAMGNELALALESYLLYARVEEEHERFRRIFEGSEEGICLLDDDGVVRAWNPALERLTGYAEEQVTGHRWSDAVVLRDAAEKRVEATDLHLLDPGAVLELVTREGPGRWVSVQAGRVEGDEAGGSVVLIADVTARRETEEAKSDFLATVSHELRTPLTMMKGSLKVLARDRSELRPGMYERMMEVMGAGVDRMERMVVSLLTVTEIEAGDLHLVSEQIDLSGVVKETVASVLAGHPRVELKMPAGDLVVRADRERLGNALGHLLDNAQKFGGVQGKIRIDVRSRDGRGIVSVTDEGPGISLADQERIFDRFVRLGPPLTRETQGAGVGMFIARRSLEAMGGSVWVESTPGKGATFHLAVPLLRTSIVLDEVAPKA